MSSKPLLAAAMVVLSLGLVACGGSGSDSTEPVPSAAEEVEEAGEEAGEDAGEAAEEAGEDAEEAGEDATDEAESEPAPSGEAQKAEKVQIVEFTYEPDPVVVQAGGKVSWQNEDTAPHTATADDGSFDTGTIDKGKIGSATFKETGTFTYFCEIHPTMHGTVEVVE